MNLAYSTSPGFAHSPDVAVITFEHGDEVLDACDCTPASLPGPGLLDQMAAKNGLKRQEFVAVGYGLSERAKNGPSAPQFRDTTFRRVATATFRSLDPNWLPLSQNPATGDGGTCYGDSGGPNFLAAPQVIAALTVTGDAYCRATNVTFRLDTPAARSFLAGFVTLPS